MTHGATYESGGPREVAEPRDFVLPLVSVIIVNYNYGRFLAEAVASVFSQTYKRVECFVVDNKSTDDSRAVLDELSQTYPMLKVIYRGSNDGQCVATVEVFPDTKGQYIVFLDADDVLLPDFIGTHIYVALSLYTHVGFTCSDMAQSVDYDVVVCTSLGIETRSCKKNQRKRLLRSLPSNLESATGLQPVAEDELQLVALTEKEWRWTATSAFMFRRDAIALLIDNPRLKVLRCALDVYFARGINTITGSVLIDRTLSIYRMHGANVFTRHAHLHNCLNFEPGSTFDQNELARRELIDFRLRSAPFFIKILRLKDDFIRGIIALNDAYPRLEDASGRSYAGARLLDNFGMLREIVGLSTVLNWCVRLRMSPFDVIHHLRRQRRREPA